jgi:hypothetical protein
MNRKKTIGGLLGMILIAVFFVTGCPQPTDDDDDTSSPVLSDNAALTAITVAGVSATLGTPSETWDDAVPGNVVLAQEALVSAEIIATPADAGARIRYGVNAPDGTPVLSAAKIYDLAENTIITVAVTPANRGPNLYYKIGVGLPDSATNLDGLSISGNSVSLAAVTDNIAQAGVANVTLKAADAAAPVIVPARGYVGQTIKYAIDGASGPAWSLVPPASFNNGDVLLVEVTSSNGESTGYYKVKVYLVQEATIKFGQPAVDGTVESLWDTAEWLPIERVFPDDSTPTFLNSPDTRGRVKVLWDETGLYVLAEVTDPSLTTGNGNTGYFDSVEIFIDEAPGISNSGTSGTGDGEYGYSNKGGLYRIGVGNVRSGDPAAAATEFNNLAKTSVQSVSGGYTIEAKIPFRATGADLRPGPGLPGGTVPAADNGKVIGFDILINACTGTGGNNTSGDGNGRQGVVAWNNASTANYQDTRGYAVGTLAGRPNTIATLLSITVGGKPAGLGTPATNYSSATAGDLKPLLGTALAAGDVAIEVVKADSHATLKYARVSGSTAPVFGDTASFTGIQDGDVIYIEATAEDGVTKLVYKVDVSVVSDQKALTAFSLASVSPTAIGTPGATFAAAGYTTDQIIRVTNQSNLTNPAIGASVSEGAVVVYGRSSAGNTAPGEWVSNFDAVSFTTGDYIGVRITAPDESVAYYKFRIAYGSSVSTLDINTLRISGRTPAVTPTAGATADTGIVGTVYLTAAQSAAGSNRIVVSKTDGDSTIAYGIGSYVFGGYWPPFAGYSVTQPTDSLAGSDWGPSVIYLVVTSEDKCSVSYYRITVTSSDVAVISEATVGGVSVTLGTPSGSYDGSTLVPGSVILTTTQAANAAVSGTTSGDDYSVTYAYLPAANAGNAPVFGAWTPQTLANGDIIYLRSDNGTGGTNYMNVYKIVVTVVE